MKKGSCVFTPSIPGHNRIREKNLIKSMFEINQDIREAWTLPSEFYISDTIFEQTRESIFSSGWQYVADAEVIGSPGQYHPVTFLPDFLDEPLILTHDDAGRQHCFSNVCTHRGNILASQPGRGNLMRCNYHGRCFTLDGRFKSMPKFESVENFPTKMDDLTNVPIYRMLNMVFVSLNPEADFEILMKPLIDRIKHLPLDSLQYQPQLSRTYHINAHWALYCDNYLEGFHIPFVHDALNSALEFSKYEYHCFPGASLQTGIAREEQPVIETPDGSPDVAKRVYGYYFWVFPNMMFNVYPWGISFNQVEPVSKEKTRILFRTYCFPGKEAMWKLTSLEETELEDEAVVEAVQKGMQSRFYRRGRFSPSMEVCVHHFHKLLAEKAR